jgi:hypothetical protein
MDIASLLAVVHFEKALREFKGLYHLIDREADLNRSGLRQAKLSCFPWEIYPVFNLTLSGATCGN